MATERGPLSHCRPRCSFIRSTRYYELDWMTPMSCRANPWHEVDPLEAASKTAPLAQPCASMWACLISTRLSSEIGPTRSRMSLWTFGSNSSWRGSPRCTSFSSGFSIFFFHNHLTGMRTSLSPGGGHFAKTTPTAETAKPACGVQVLIKTISSAFIICKMAVSLLAGLPLRSIASRLRPGLALATHASIPNMALVRFSVTCLRVDGSCPNRARPRSSTSLPRTSQHAAFAHARRQKDRAHLRQERAARPAGKAGCDDRA
jgi:hypothetical protein